jgi:F-type H+-transporting ATPase subunit a
MGIEAINAFELPLLNTVLLLASGVTITYSHHSLIQGNRNGALYGAMFTIVLALIFTAFQGVEYSVSSFTLSDGAFGSCFYFGTGFHGLEFFSLFVPAGCSLGLLPLLVLIEFISYLARNVSLGLRLAANILSGHMLLNILSGFTYNIMTSGFIFFFLGLFPLAFIIAFSGLELGIAFIQAQVFIVLSCSYIKDALDLH